MIHVPGWLCALKEAARSLTWHRRSGIWGCTRGRSRWTHRQLKDSVSPATAHWKQNQIRRQSRGHTTADPMDRRWHSSLKTESDQSVWRAGGGGGAHNNISYGQVMALLTENKTGSYVSQGEHTTANPMDSQWHNSMKTESDQMPVGRVGGGGGGVGSTQHQTLQTGCSMAHWKQNQIRRHWGDTQQQFLLTGYFRNKAWY